MFGGAVSVAVIAAFGNGLQGWDNAAIAGSLLYITPEFHLEDSPQVVGSIVAASLIGSVLSTFVAGPAADWLGRKAVLLVAASCYIIGALIDGWSPNVTILIPGRAILGFSVGLIATIAPLFIAECSPSEIRGQLATLPQLMGIIGMLTAYGAVFLLSLSDDPSWRSMLGLALAPAAVYLGLGILFLPESPRWLVSKGRMKEARQVLVNLRGTEDVAGELSMLVEGLGVGGEATLEEWLLKPAETTGGEEEPLEAEAGQIRLVGTEPGVVWIAQPMPKEEEKDEDHTVEKEDTSLITSLSQMAVHSFQVDQVVMLMNEIQDHKEGHNEENHEPREGVIFEDYLDDHTENVKDDVEHGMVGDFDDENLQKPLLGSPYPSRTTSDRERHFLKQSSQNSSNFVSGFDRTLSTNSCPTKSSMPESIVGSAGGGWHLAWQVEAHAESAADAHNRDADEGMKRVFLLQEPSDLLSIPNTMALPGISAAGEQETFQAQVLVTNPPQLGREFLPADVAGPAMVHPSMIAQRGPAWTEIMEPGVLQALVVGISLQALQQACGINAVLYYTPTILMNSGAGMLESLGLTSQSSSILASMATTFLMLPCIFLAMWLMDRSGRRQLLLTTIPLMTISLSLLSFSSILLTPGSVFQSVSSLSGVALFSCSFVTGFGPIPNIICSEIFPTRVRGVCIGLCAATMWACNIAVSQAFPDLQTALGLGGVFGVFGLMTVVSWVFIFLRVPETKGLPLELISEIFAMSARDKKAHHDEAHEAHGKAHEEGYRAL